MTNGDRRKQKTRGRASPAAKRVRLRQKGKEGPFKYCVPERMTLAELGKVPLPGPQLTMNELFRQFFHFENNFAGCVRALEEAGRLPVRGDGSYRLSDGYLILSHASWHTAVEVGTFKSRPAFAPNLSLEPLDEAWWNALDAVAAASSKVRQARLNPVIRNRKAGTVRVASDDELKAKAQKVLRAAQKEQLVLAQSLPSDHEWWRVRLRVHAQLVVELRESAFTNLARLCDGHLSLAVELAEVRLGLTRSELRTMVGVVTGDMTTMALTAASFSLATRARDESLGRLVEMIPEYNAACAADLQIQPNDVQDLLENLTQAGLDDWVLQLSAEAWHPELMSRMNDDQLVAMSFGRVRTMCALLEEGMLSFAAATRHRGFTSDVAASPTMGERLETFLNGPKRRQGVTGDVGQRVALVPKKQSESTDRAPGPCEVSEWTDDARTAAFGMAWARFGSRTRRPVLHSKPYKPSLSDRGVRRS